MTKFISNLKKYRQFNELTQEELANKVNVRRETIARLENAKYNPSLELAVRISNELNIPLEKLFVFEF
ncbi:HTH-type transcriptional regulator [[Clostridium] sordellii]|uniref:helix-turn-helix transcriptional regulator n=1 Tax=Paraclostridium sordellii TaxID=1505 RepID=UPI0005E4DC65|nr:helix-turn-helix domain-containing protein [Paeniclostridium sordellii]MDU5021531.1 helix-turn-helix domain-containing protein [Clostridiales bacterium]AUN14232.1 transcriptional regulator [Paeniclostridium sordellii]MDU1455461.1 helix-turn-helix domain-containing protein [Paeniclostridium sordellii]MDU2148384.1 helix-turn-helix domain-containing protein [Paeniclostridium sordellii]CEN75027.1 HTH-type transcriptional regulator [[Clostridium] sordellii] [Paeniclostridium sordellii]